MSAGHVWKMCAAVGRVSPPFPGELWKYNGEMLRVDGGVVKRIATDNDGWYWGAVSENAAAPNSGVHCWTVEVVNTDIGGIVAGVCTAEADPATMCNLTERDCAKGYYLANSSFFGGLPGAGTSEEASGLTEAFKNKALD